MAHEYSPVVVAEFTSHCRRFFRTGDPMSRAIINAVERQDSTPPTGTEFATAEFTAALQQMLGGEGQLPLGNFDSALMRQLRHAKDAAREEFHRENTRRQTQELEQLLKATTARAASNQGVMPRVGSPLLGGGHESQSGALSPTSLPSLRRFATAHRSNIGAHPFLAGLNQCLLEQIGDHRCCVWTFEDEVLTQAAPGFAEAAVNVLVEGLGFQPDLRGSSGIGGSDLESGGCGRSWLVAAGLTDSECGSLLAILPKQSDLYARPTGTVTKHSNMVRVPWWDCGGRDSGRSRRGMLAVGLVAAAVFLLIKLVKLRR
eukprot:COSAG05_NODE_1202_length_5536_cov_1.814420_2_plen_316_part_00